MSQLPTPGASDGVWGDMLNDFLLQAHNSDGSIKSGIVQVVSSGITDATTTGKSLLTASSATAARTTLGAGTSNLVIGTTSGTAADAAALATSLAAKAPLASPTFTGTVSGITKAMVGLTNVDNTSDVNKPVSTATSTALAGKAATVHTHVATDITNSTTVGRAVLTATDAPTARTAIGAGTSSVVIGTTAGTAADAGALATSLAGVVKSDGVVLKVLSISQASYNALGTKDPGTLYIITS